MLMLKGTVKMMMIMLQEVAGEDLVVEAKATRKIENRLSKLVRSGESYDLQLWTVL